MFGIAFIVLSVIAFFVGKRRAYRFISNFKTLERETEDRIQGVMACLGALTPFFVLALMSPLWIIGIWLPFYFFILPFWLEYKVAVGRY